MTCTGSQSCANAFLSIEFIKRRVDVCLPPTPVLWAEGECLHVTKDIIAVLRDASSLHTDAHARLAVVTLAAETFAFRVRRVIVMIKVTFCLVLDC